MAIQTSVQAAAISWLSPSDGGTPRDLQRIEGLNPTEFRVRAAFEDGGASVLRHAVSRMDLICRNDTTNTQGVTIHVDLSDGGRRTDFDNKPEAGMRWRDFIFIQPPGSDWRQISGRTEGWVATITFPASPGETRAGLSPWYTYEDYQRFVRGLPAHPHLTKQLRSRSDGGREHWELTITDPRAPGPKRTIYWQAREHAYETFSSFAMEGLVSFLLSDEAAEFRKRFVIVLHPMTNVDGVAQGFEYRAGYDFPDPRGTATGRFTFETVDRLRPDFAVAWHNWIAPRDRNVVFYTDGDGGRATPRAWLRFTQLFPSLRENEHRWKDETTPLKYNWERRQPLSEANIHQYAMKKYGTRIWGWEMPWWNHTTDQARAIGAAFARAFLATIEEIRTDSCPVNASLPTTSSAVPEVARWEMHEFVTKGRAHVANPFRQGALVGEFISPTGRTNVIDGFYDGDDVWRLRFAPDLEGEWSYLLRGEGVEILQRGKLRCTKPRGHGGIGIHPENPYAFAHADGTPFFPMGDTCYGLFDDTPITPSLRAAYLQTRRAQRFNFVRFTVGHSEARATTNRAYWAWGWHDTGGAINGGAADLDRFNPEFFQKFDTLMRDLRAHGMQAEIILLNFYRRPFTDTNAWTSARERRWLHYLVARYGAFDHVFLWTVANEYETHPDGKYRLDFPDDVEWARNTARFIKKNDPYRHLVTVHPVISASRRGESPRAAFEAPWRIGEFFGADDAFDVLSQQTGQMGEGTVWDEQRRCWTGDSATLVASLTADRRYRKPVLNSENGYEYLRDHPTEKKQVHHTDKVRRTAWRIVCAGGYFAAGFHGTIGHSDAWNRIDPTNYYTFTLRDEGAAAQLAALHDFFVPLPFWRMQPWMEVRGSPDVVALADPAGTLVIYFPHGGSATFERWPWPGPAALQGRWFNPRRGTFAESFTVPPNGPHAFTAPDAEDWVLLGQSTR